MTEEVKVHRLHPLSPRLFHPDARALVTRFQKRGHPTYFTGGAVRDLALRVYPRDIDIGTLASDEVISAILGLPSRAPSRVPRVLPDEQTLEIDVFPMRAPPWIAPRDWRARPKSGDPSRDFAESFDFTINGLLYDPTEDTLIDYLGGMRDLELRQLRRVGDQHELFRKDPVSILRGVTLASKLGLTLEARTWEGMGRHVGDIATSNPARLGAHVIKLLTCRAAGKAIGLMRELGALPLFFPPAVVELLSTEASAGPTLRALDGAPKAGLPVAVLFAALLDEPVRRACERTGAAGRAEIVQAEVAAFAARFRLSARTWSEVRELLAPSEDAREESAAREAREKKKRRAGQDARAAFRAILDAVRSEGAARQTVG